MIGSQIAIAKVLDLKQLLAMLPFSRATLYRKIKKGEFPNPIDNQSGKQYWRLEDIMKWRQQ